jgi:2-(1,2-epoxy-1,2-dihydrophenyl)acetyl-CoA isomerase
MAIGLAKKAINTALDTDLKTTLEFDVDAQSVCLQSEDAREGIMAKAEKREPIFKGK